MEIGGWIALAALWALLNLVTRKQGRPPRDRRYEPQAGPPLPAPHPESPDATQREGSRLERLLREFERALEQGRPLERVTTLPVPSPEAVGGAPEASLPSREEFEERGSLEGQPEVVTLETDVRREARRLVDQDEEAEEIVARRIGAAAARDRATSRPDRATFDPRIRQEPADHTGTRHTARQLRDAVIWREILGPPVSLRREE